MKLLAEDVSLVWGIVTGPAGTFRQRTEVSRAQPDILAQPKIDPSPGITQIATGTT